MVKKNITFILSLCVAIGIVTFVVYIKKEQSHDNVQKEYTAILGSQSSVNTDLIIAYKKEVLRALEEKKPVVLSASELEGAKASRAQEIALQSDDFLADLIDVDTQKVLHNDIMRVYTVPRSEQGQHEIYRVEKYNFFSNTTTVALVDIEQEEVISIEQFENMQGEISLRLRKIAQEIAVYAPEVQEALGYKPKTRDATMANVRTALTQTSCERSKHLCVAPTFLDYEKEEALWAIVDLTNLTLVGARFTDLGSSTTPTLVSERDLQNRYVMERFCKKDNVFVDGKWQLGYRLTNSDGLEVYSVLYDGKKVLDSAKIVDWHVSYAQKDKKILERAETDNPVQLEENSSGTFAFGYSDATGCPLFSTSSVIPFNGPEFRDIIGENGEKIGFSVVQDFRNPSWPLACNYRYQNKFEFYNDGSFRVAGVNRGRGCGASGWYRPVFRIDLAVNSQGGETFSAFTEGAWHTWDKERWHLQKTNVELSDENYLFALSDRSRKEGFYIEPNVGQFGDGSRGDHAYSFVTIDHPEKDEGKADLITIGPCCNTNFEQGPEKFMDPPEELEGKNLIFWYVPQIKNDDTEGEEYCWADTIVDESGHADVVSWPCTVGPKFTPFTQ